MKIVIHTHVYPYEKIVLEGDRQSIERQIAQRFPWFTEWHEKLEDILASMDDSQAFSIEVLDDQEHPLYNYINE